MEIVVNPLIEEYRPTMQSNTSTEKFEGSCYCGACQFICEGEPFFRVICHCLICTRISGGIALALVGFADERLKIVQGSDHLRGFKSSERMERFHCNICSSNVYNQSLLTDHLFRDTPLVNFRRNERGQILNLNQLQPDSHMFFSRCQPCYIDMFKTDGLIKFSEMPGSTIIPNVSSK